ncbi:amidohydrolase family protein [Paraburkholderia sp. ZP32-5]|uniref:amidohydrolase family protein n=1 Tax=Paraburkholderia sp. ZP32-5 TaxID=2883245 RepID=UPI001F1BCE91|nr:amidohydrolase family protein [Paraburkholderia sp. ZP32-5]
MHIVKMPHVPVRPEWLALRSEAILEPELPIIDPHHHLWDRAGSRYLIHELYDDLNSGHRIVATVFIQNRAMLRKDGPEEMVPVGEVDFANGAAAFGASGLYGNARACAGIVAGPDLTLGDRVEPVLEAMQRIAGPRLVGVRNALVWHASPEVRSSTMSPPQGLMADAAFRRGVAALERFGLSLDIWAYHTQLGEIYDLARACPGVTMIVDHFGGPVGTGPHAADMQATFDTWRADMRRLAALPNIVVKLGGGGMPVLGFNFEREEMPPASAQLADAWRGYVETCIELFGCERCMFESNFPVDKGMFSYAILWNAFKRLAAHASSAEKAALFHDTAARIYRLAPGAGQ